MAHLRVLFLRRIFLGNAIPHSVSGTMGRAFQSPFAHPPGKGLSSALVNVLWGAFNIVVGYVLVLRVGTFDLRDTWDAVALGAGFVIIGTVSARLFGPFHGGDMKGGVKLDAAFPREYREL
jgi:hypothetical protein